MKSSISNLDLSLSNGDLSPATEWLRENVQVHGSLFEPKATIEKATGNEVSLDPLLNYLEEKYKDLYGL